MPPRWPRKPDRADPAFRRLDDRMTFATHVAACLAINSGLWFFRQLGEFSTGVPGGLALTPWITGIWAAVLVTHGIYVFAIAQYDDPLSTPKDNSPSG